MHFIQQGNATVCVIIRICPLNAPLRCGLYSSMHKDNGGVNVIWRTSWKEYFVNASFTALYGKQFHKGKTKKTRSLDEIMISVQNAQTNELITVLLAMKASSITGFSGSSINQHFMKLGPLCHSLEHSYFQNKISISRFTPSPHTHTHICTKICILDQFRCHTLGPTNHVLLEECVPSLKVPSSLLCSCT